jgi:hypothetical protein
MQRLLIRLAAETVFLSHALAVSIITLGWAIPALYPIHLVLLFGGGVLQMMLGHCFLSRWEFALRRKLDPAISYDSAYITHYMRVLFGDQIRPEFMNVVVPASFAGLICVHLGLYLYTVIT